jgi:hypothetical protein
MEAIVSEPLAVELVKPSARRLGTIGACVAASALLWLAAGVLGYLVEEIDVPRAAFSLTAYVAVAVTTTAVILATSYLNQQANAHNQAVILAAIGQLAAEHEQLSAKVDKVNPWEIYSQAAEDLLRGERKP